MHSNRRPTQDPLFRTAELACLKKILFLKCQMPTARSERSYRFLHGLVSRERDLLRRIRAAQAVPDGVAH